MAGGVNSVSPHEYEPGPPERASWRAPDRPRDTQNGRRLHVGVPRSHPLQTRKSQNSYGHPSKEVLDLLGSVGTTIYCSEKVDDCRSGCPSMDSRTVCFRKDRPLRMGWGTAPYCKMVK